MVRLRALGVEQAIDMAIHDPRVGVTRDHGAGVIHVPGAEQDTPDLVLGAEQLAQCQRLETGKIDQMTQTTKNE